jgi:hypothetical protein
MSELFVQPGGVRSISQVHDQVASAISQLTSGAGVDATGVQNTHGNIAASVSTALSSVLGSRQSALQTTSKAGAAISGLLAEAARLYEQGDQQGAEKLKAAAAALEGAGGSTAGDASSAGGGSTAGAQSAAGATGAATGASTGGSSAGGGASAAGSMVGQIAQQAGQAVGQAAQSLGGMVGGLAQLPGQVMQGVSQIVQTAAGAAGSAQAGVDTAAAADDKGSTGDTAPRSADGDRPSDETPTQAPAAQAPAEGASAGAPAAGSAPVEQTAPQRPAQTRPQVD